MKARDEAAVVHTHQACPQKCKSKRMPIFERFFPHRTRKLPPPPSPPCARTTPSDAQGNPRGVLPFRGNGAGRGSRATTATRIAPAQVLDSRPLGPRREISPALVKRRGAGAPQERPLLSRPSVVPYYCCIFLVLYVDTLTARNSPADRCWVMILDSKSVLIISI